MHLRAAKGYTLAQCYIPTCLHLSDYQCDFPMNRNQAGRVIKTCDQHICEDHVKHGATAGVDFCEEHYEIAKAAYEKRMASMPKTE